MHIKKQDGILDRLGLTADAMTRARSLDERVDDACRDLESVGDLLEAGSKDPDLVKLARELESEIRKRLETGPEQ